MLNHPGELSLHLYLYLKTLNRSAPGHLSECPSRNFFEEIKKFKESIRSCFCLYKKSGPIITFIYFLLFFSTQVSQMLYIHALSSVLFALPDTKSRRHSELLRQEYSQSDISSVPFLHKLLIKEKQEVHKTLYADRKRGCKLIRILQSFMLTVKVNAHPTISSPGSKNSSTLLRTQVHSCSRKHKVNTNVQLSQW